MRALDLGYSRTSDRGCSRTTAGEEGIIVSHDSRVVVKPNWASRVMCRRASSKVDFFCEVFRFFFGSPSRERGIDQRSSFAETQVLAFRNTVEYRASAPTGEPKTRFAAASWWVPLLGSLLVLTAVGRRMVLDDHVLSLQARGDPPSQVGPHRAGISLHSPAVIVRKPAAD